MKVLKKQTGMSLLEIIVSMLICGIGFAGLLAAIQASQRMASAAEYRSIATREIQSAVDMMRANRLGADAYIKATNSEQDKETNPYGDAGLALCQDRTPDDGAGGDRKVNPPTPRSICLNAMDQAKKIAELEAQQWKARIANSLPGGNGEIIGSKAGGIYIFTVRISWIVDNKFVTTSYSGSGSSSSGGSSSTGGSTGVGIPSLPVSNQVYNSSTGYDTEICKGCILNFNGVNYTVVDSYTGRNSANVGYTHWMIDKDNNLYSLENLPNYNTNGYALLRWRDTNQGGGGLVEGIHTPESGFVQRKYDGDIKYNSGTTGSNSANSCTINLSNGNNVAGVQVNDSCVPIDSIQMSFAL